MTSEYIGPITPIIEATEDTTRLTTFDPETGKMLFTWEMTSRQALEVSSMLMEKTLEAKAAINGAA